MLFAYTVFPAASAMACDCAIYPPPEAFERSGAVFAGKVIDTGGFINPYVDFAVEKSWKSVDVDEVSLSIRGCDGMSFVVGEKYLVYAYGDEYFLSTGDCTRTATLVKAVEDFNYLKDKKTIPLHKQFFTRNVKTGLITAAFVLTLLGVGFVAMRFKKH